MSLSQSQYEQLLRPINPLRVGSVKTDRGEMSHVEAYEIRAHLNRIFGFLGWSEEVLTQELVFEEEAKTRAGKDAWRVCYRSTLRLTVRAGDLVGVYTEGATGDALIPQRAESHDMALKTSQSQALKRCAANLGDQFGLSLYNKGSRVPLVRSSLVSYSPDPPPAGDVTGHITSQLAPEGSEERAQETNAPDPTGSPTTASSPGGATSTTTGGTSSAPAESVPAESSPATSDIAEAVRRFVGTLPSEAVDGHGDLMEPPVRTEPDPTAPGAPVTAATASAGTTEAPATETPSPSAPQEVPTPTTADPSNAPDPGSGADSALATIKARIAALKLMTDAEECAAVVRDMIVDATEHNLLGITNSAGKTLGAALNQMLAEYSTP